LSSQGGNQVSKAILRQIDLALVLQKENPTYQLNTSIDAQVGLKQHLVTDYR
jgi:hypothetical protein